MNIKDMKECKKITKEYMGKTYIMYDLSDTVKDEADEILCPHCVDKLRILLNCSEGHRR